jgi:hypothetical protein
MIVLMYLAGTVELGITYGPKASISMHLEAHANADWAGDVDARQSTTGSHYVR